MTLIQLFRIVMKRLGIILVFALIGASVTGVVSWFFMEDVYQASATIIVSNKQPGGNAERLTYSDYTLNIQLVNSYRILCKTDRVLNQVIDQLGLNMTTSQLAGKITVTSEDDTEIIRLAVKDTDPSTAQQIANTLATVFESEVVVIMKMDNVQIIDLATLPAAPVEPNRMNNVLLGLFSGVALGIGFAVLLEYLDRSIKTEEQIFDLLGVPVLGSVPHVDYT